MMAKFLLSIILMVFCLSCNNNKVKLEDVIAPNLYLENLPERRMNTNVLQFDQKGGEQILSYANDSFSWHLHLINGRDIAHDSLYIRNADSIIGPNIKLIRQGREIKVIITPKKDSSISTAYLSLNPMEAGEEDILIVQYPEDLPLLKYYPPREFPSNEGFRLTTRLPTTTTD
ncbi:hypothetical protein [Parabacteroides distasonis]